MEDCCEEKSFLKRLFTSPIETGCKFEAKIRRKLLEEENAALKTRVEELEEIVRFGRDAISYHSASIHVNDNAGDKLFERMAKAREQRDEHKKKMDAAKIPAWKPFSFEKKKA